MSGVHNCGGAAASPQVAQARNPGGFARAGNAGRPEGAGFQRGGRPDGVKPGGFEGAGRAEGAGFQRGGRPEGVKPGEKLESALQAAGYDQETIDQVTAEVKTAVESAFQEHQNSGAEGSPRESVRTAVGETLKKYGIDPAEIRGDVSPEDTSSIDQSV